MTPTASGGPAIPGASLLVAGHHTDGPSWDDVRAARDTGHVLWLDLERPTTDDLRELAATFGLHDETVVDSGAFNQRTRLSEYDGYVVVVAYGVAADDETLQELHVYVLPHALITVRREDITEITALHDRDMVVTEHTTVPALLSRVLSTLIGTFAGALEQVDDALTELEQAILDSPAPDQLQQLMTLRRRVNRFRRAVDPARDLVGAGRFVVVDTLEDLSDDTRRHLRDLAIDLAYIGDQLEAERDRLQGVMDVYMNELNNRQNKIMKQLAAVSTIFLPLTFLTGYFGMNFAAMVKGINSPAAYGALGVGLPLAAVAGAMFVLKRRGWW
ncbi:MAG: magnesium transporter CorA family protein [Microthrixaceae bacterium]